MQGLIQSHQEFMAVVSKLVDKKEVGNVTASFPPPVAKKSTTKSVPVDDEEDEEEEPSVLDPLLSESKRGPLSAAHTHGVLRGTLDNVHLDGSLAMLTPSQLREDTLTPFAPAQRVAINAGHGGSYRKFVQHTDWKDNRSRHEARALARVMDAWYHEHGESTLTSMGFEILSRRIASLAYINVGGKDAVKVADQMEATDSMVAGLIPRQAFLASVKTANMMRGAPDSHSAPEREEPKPRAGGGWHGKNYGKNQKKGTGGAGSKAASAGARE